MGKKKGGNLYPNTRNEGVRFKNPTKGNRNQCM